MEQEPRYIRYKVSTFVLSIKNNKFSLSLLRGRPDHYQGTYILGTYAARSKSHSRKVEYLSIDALSFKI